MNPYGPHPRVVAAAASAAVSRYPETDAWSVREAYGAEHGLTPGEVLAGNGSSELIYLAAQAFGRGETCLVVGPTFGEYAAAAIAAGMNVIESRWFEPRATRADITKLVARVVEERPSLVFLCNPNNPTGTLTSLADVELLTATVLEYGGRLIVDQAYMDFAWPEDESVGPATGRLVLRSLTKLHAIPGLRAGFLIGSAGDIEMVARQQPPWSLGAPAAAAVLQALAERDFVADSWQRVAATRAALCDSLTEAGFDVQPSLANFVLVRAGEADPLRARLLGRGFVVRDCTSFGLAGHVRIAVPHEDHLSALVAAMKEER